MGRSRSQCSRMRRPRPRQLRSRVLRRLEKEADVIYREAVRGLFADDKIDGRVLLREKEVLDDLEKAIDRCEYVADTLANLAVKNG